MIHYSKLTIFFGERTSSIDKDQKTVNEQPSWQCVADTIKATNLFGVQQSHGIVGLEINQHTDLQQSFLTDADFLYTSTIGYGLAVTTADCMPIVLYDQSHNAVALVHAGWKGIVAGIIKQAVMTMQKKYNSDVTQLVVFIGPCARHCCYEIQHDLYTKLSICVPKNEQIFVHRNNKLFVDLVHCAQLQLNACGIVTENIHTNNAVCTLCNTHYCSYRRDKNNLRNITAVVLNG